MIPFPISETSPVEHAADLPAEADCVIIGGGVIGVSAALYLARNGLKPVLLEKGRIAGEQSARNWGWIRVQGRDMAEIPIALEAQRLWQELDTECGGRLGTSVCGVSYLAKSEAEMAGFEGWLSEAKPLGVTSQVMGRKGVDQVFPGNQGSWAGVLHTPSDMRAEPWVAVPELARLAVSEGAVIVENCAVRALDRQGGRVAGVVTERGRVRCPHVVLAGGAWSALFLRRHGISIPQLSVRSSILATDPMPQVTNGSGVEKKFAFRRRADGGYSLAPAGFSELFIGPDAFRAVPKYIPLLREGSFDNKYKALAPKGYPDAWGTPRKWREDEQTPFERMRVLNPQPNMAKLRQVAARFSQAFPEVGQVSIKSAWAGLIDVLPDVVPIVDEVPEARGLITVTGMCGHGFGIGPAFGRIIADMIAGNPVGYDMSRFRFDRFRDGTPIIPGPNI